MQRWRGKVAVVTGASAGIGLVIAETLIREGLTVVGLARRKEKMLSCITVPERDEKCRGPGKFFARKCDVTKEKDVVEAFAYIKEKFETVHILINNAGIFKMKTIEEADMKELEEVINVNLVGLVHCCKQAIKLMKEHDHEAHIINMNSTGGHRVPKIITPDGTKVNMNIYSPTKYAVTSLSEVLTNELAGSKIRITNLSPGYVQTDLVEVGATEHVKNVSTTIPSLTSKDVADAVVYILGTPHHVQIADLIFKPLGQSF